MPWPTVAVITTGMDADTDTIPRSDILDLTTKFNEVIAARGQAGGVCELDGSSLVPVARIPASIARLTLTGNLAINEARANITMDATLMNLWAGPSILDGTGTAPTITGIVDAPQPGVRRVLYPLSGSVLTHGATFDVDGNVNRTAAAGERWEFVAKTVNTYRVHVTKDDGTPVVATGVTSFNARLGSVTLTSGDVTSALGYVPQEVDTVYLCTTNSDVNLNPGDLIAGSSLVYSGLAHNTAVNNLASVIASTGPLTGTWRSLCFLTAGTGTSRQTGIFRKVA